MAELHSPTFRAHQARFRAAQVAKLHACAEIASAEHMHREQQAADVVQANTWLRDFVGRIVIPTIELPRTQGHGIRIAADQPDSATRAHAQALALECAAILAHSEEPAAEINGIAGAAGLARSFSAAVERGETWRRRVVCPVWWRRALRRALARRTDAAMRAAALVKRSRASYCSQPALLRWRERQAENANLLAMLVAVPSSGGAPISLQELAQASTANPEIRRAELMTRVAGFERIAQARGDEGLFLTLTAPSRFHRYSAGGSDNPKWSGESPADAQIYLRAVWARTRAALARQRLPIYGFRVAEPHHDGCPHWHMFVFAAPEALASVEKTCRRYALQDSPGEPGAWKNRFAARRCDPAKGSAAGYIAKYIAKNIDGTGIDRDTETGEQAITSAGRVRAWASTWGIRQFQQIGGASVSVWRELRRLARQSVRPAQPEHIEHTIAAADSGDWAEYTTRMGGPVAKRRERPIVVTRSTGDESTGEVYAGRYADIVPRIVGLSHAFGEIVTRWIRWTVQAADEAIIQAARMASTLTPHTGPPAVAAGGLLL